MKKRYMIALGAMIVFLLVIVFAIVLPKLHKGTISLNMTGGDPSFGVKNQGMAEFNKSIGYHVTVVSVDKTTDYPDMSNVDLVQGGTLGATDELKARKDVKVFGEMVIASSANMLWVKSNLSTDELKHLVESGFVKIAESGGVKYYTMDPDKLAALINGEIAGKTYAEVGVTGLDKKIKIGFPNSTGGRNSAAQLLACIFPDNNEQYCNEMVTPDQFNTNPRFKDALYALYVNAGRQPAQTYSVDYCVQWLNSVTNSVTLAIFPESCYGAWKLALTTDSQKKNAEARGNVGIYLTKTVVQQFTLVATSQKGLDYITLLKEKQADQFAQVLTDTTGMRGSGLQSVPPVKLASFIAPNEPYEPMTFPFSALTNAIKEALKSYGN